MKKLGTIFLVVLLAMFICSCGTKQAVQRENPDFRNVKWGDSSETVKQYETETELSETSAGLIGAVRIENLDAWLIYTFDGSDTLHTAVYDFNKLNYSNAGQYIPIYEGLKESLIQKYGEPSKDEIVKMADQSLIDMAGESNALEYGYVTYVAYWETDKADISIGLLAQNYEVHLVISYNDPNYDSNNSGL